MSKEVPLYPAARELYSRTVTLAGGGGGIDRRYASSDPLEQVVAFYEQQFGSWDGEPGTYRWHFVEMHRDWESHWLVVVEGQPDATTGDLPGSSIYIGRRDVRRQSD